MQVYAVVRCMFCGEITGQITFQRGAWVVRWCDGQARFVCWQGMLVALAEVNLYPAAI